MWGAFCTGLLAAIIQYFGRMLVVKAGVDDPLDATAGMNAHVLNMLIIRYKPYFVFLFCTGIFYSKSV